MGFSGCRRLQNLKVCPDSSERTKGKWLSSIPSARNWQIRLSSCTQTRVAKSLFEVAEICTAMFLLTSPVSNLTLFLSSSASTDSGLTSHHRERRRPNYPEAIRSEPSIIHPGEWGVWGRPIPHSQLWQCCRSHGLQNH
jgi:hypothetical protein